MLLEPGSYLDIIEKMYSNSLSVNEGKRGRVILHKEAIREAGKSPGFKSYFFE